MKYLVLEMAVHWTVNTVHSTYFMYKAEIKPFTDIDIRLKILFSVSMIWNILFCVSMIWKLLFSDSYDTGMKDSVLSIILGHDLGLWKILF